MDDIDTLLLDHASLELKAAQQAQKLIRAVSLSGRQHELAGVAAAGRDLIFRMSRLAREELRHFEQVIGIIERRGKSYRAISPARYAGALHDLAEKREPYVLVDELIIGAVIEARSCERFFSLAEQRERLDSVLVDFYASLLKAECRHFEHYLDLARRVASCDISPRVERFLAKDAELIAACETELRFLGGIPEATLA